MKQHIYSISSSNILLHIIENVRSKSKGTNFLGNSSEKAGNLVMVYIVKETNKGKGKINAPYICKNTVL